MIYGTDRGRRLALPHDGGPAAAGKVWLSLTLDTRRSGFRAGTQMARWPERYATGRQSRSVDT
jgi:hypothetical protein